jgi:hypothetical protein
VRSIGDWTEEGYGHSGFVKEKLVKDGGCGAVVINITGWRHPFGKGSNN